MQKNLKTLSFNRRLEHENLGYSSKSGRHISPESMTTSLIGKKSLQLHIEKQGKFLKQFTFRR